jgi:tocopherol cyclase
VWPKAFAGGGLSSAIPFLTQYWHPCRLGGAATGTVGFGGAHWSFDNAALYAEKNWGPAFPERWWRVRARDFGGADVSVAFTGGLLQLGPISRDLGRVVVRLGDRLIRIAPPAQVRCRVSEERWSARAGSPRYQIDLDGHGPPYSAVPCPP